MADRSNSKLIIRNLGNYFRSIDVPLFATVVALSLFSILNMYGISGLAGGFVTKQSVMVGIGLALFVLFSFFNYRYLKNYSLPVILFYFISIALLMFTFYSHSIRGVKSWIIIGGYTYEPSELAKLVIIILMAKYFSQRHTQINDYRHIIISGIYFAIPAAIIILQPDLGSAIIFTLIWLGILLASGINKKHLLVLILIGLILAGGSWLFVLKDYQKARIVSFLNPYKDPRGIGYNLIQSKIAIGSGYFLGNGLGKGTQTKLGFLPEPKNDFVFASLTEQFGLLGAIAVLSAILFLVARIIKIGTRANNNFGKLFALGLAIFILAHAFIGVAVNIGLMPVTGIPFPFLSFGGSNLISIMAGLGILQSIKRYG